MSSLARTLAAALPLLFACGGAPEDALHAIRALQDEGRFEDSIEPLRALLDERSGGGEVAYRYSVALAQTGRSTQAFWSLREAMKDPAWLVRAGTLLAELALRSGNPDVAIQVLDEVLEREPEQVDALSLRCRARLHNRRDYEGALADVDRLLALDPERRDAVPLRVVALLGLHRVEEAGSALETLERQQLEGEGANPAAAALSCAARGRFKRESGELDAAEQVYSECLERYPADVGVVSESLEFFEERQRPERIEEILTAANQAAPAHRYFRITLADWYQLRGDAAKAEALLRSATEGDLDVQAWRDLAAYLSQTGRPDEGLAAWRRAVSIQTPADPELRFAFGEALLAAGESDEAREVAEALEVAPYRELLLGRLAFAQRDYARALAHLGEGNRLWPDNAIARFYTALAAEQTGDFARAVEEYHAAMRVDANAADTRARLARLHLAAGEYRDATFVLDYQGTGDAPPLRSGPLVLLELEAHAALGDLGRGVPAALQPFLRDPDFWGSALAAVAKGVRRQAGPQAAVEVIRGADRLDLTSPVALPALQSLARDLSAQGQHDEAIALARQAAAAQPLAAFEEILGRALAAGGRSEEAAAAFERALALEADRPGALLGLARLAEARGDVPAALARYARIDSERAGDSEAALAHAGLLAAEGRAADAARELRAALERDPIDGSVALALASLEGAGAADRDERIALARRALRFGQGDAARSLLERLGAA